MRRTLTFTRAAILNRRKRTVPMVAFSKAVPRTQRTGLQMREHQVGKGTQPESQLIGGHCMGAGTIGEQILRLFLDPVLHVPPGAVKVLVETACIEHIFAQMGHYKARVLAPVKKLGFAYNATRTAPTLQCAVLELDEAAGWQIRGLLPQGFEAF